MNAVTQLAQKARSPADPRIEQIGPTSRTSADGMARSLGWFSCALGAVELFFPGVLTRSLGLEGKEGLLRAYGAREILAGVQTLSIDKEIGLASRIAGDMLDLATLMPALSERNPKQANAMAAFGAVLAVTVLDCIAYAAVTRVHTRNRGATRDYSDRSGLPRGIEASRGLARSSAPQEVRPPALAAS
jgi:hypothetical protein